MSDDLKNPPKTEKQKQYDWHKDQARKKTPAYKDEQKKKLQDALKQLEPVAKPEEVKKSEWTNEPITLSKGSLQSRVPFNPNKVPDLDRENVELWTNGDSSDRDDIPKLEGAGRVRALHKLHAKTDVRVNKETGQREFLLHRGMGPSEYNSHTGTRTNNSGRTSWTPNKSVAHDFASDYADHGDVGEKNNGYGTSGVVSAWMPEDSIHHIPNQIGSKFADTFDNKATLPKPIRSHRYNEHEIIVTDHRHGEIADQYTINEHNAKKAKAKMKPEEKLAASESGLKKTMTIGHAVGPESTKTGGAAIAGDITPLKTKPMASPANASKLKSRMARIQAAKELAAKNPKEDWQKHLALKTEALADKAREALAKSRGELNFPQLGVKTSGSNIKVVTTPKQKKTHARAIANELVGPKIEAQIDKYVSDRGGSPEAAAKSKQEVRDAQTKRMDNNNSPSKVGGAVVYGKNDAGSRSNGMKAFGHVFDGKYSVADKGIPDKKLDKDKLAIRGRWTEATKSHEAQHMAFHEIKTKHGHEFANKLSHHLVSKSFDKDTMRLLVSHCISKGYMGSPAFNEEVLNHARDIVTNEKARGWFHQSQRRDPNSDDARKVEAGIKKGWENALNNAKDAHKDMFNTEEKLAASENGKDNE